MEGWGGREAAELAKAAGCAIAAEATPAHLEEEERRLRVLGCWRVAHSMSQPTKGWGSRQRAAFEVRPREEEDEVERNVVSWAASPLECVPCRASAAGAQPA